VSIAAPEDLGSPDAVDAPEVTDAGRPRSGGLWRRLAGIAAGVAVAAAGLGFILAAPLPGTAAEEARATGRGIIDYRLEQAAVDPAAIPAMVAEMGGDRLRAGWTRVLVHWATLQPKAPGTAWSGDTDGDGYEDAYLAQLDAIVNQLDAAGISIVLTPVDVPRWASDREVWQRPYPGFPKGVYQPFYAPDMGDVVVRGQFRALGKLLAGRYEGKASHLECWNEPNQGTYLYPQSPVSATNGGGRVYLQMLKQWWSGVRAGSGTAVVIGGATAPRGRGDTVSTPPQAFARYLKENGAGAFMHAYSHHPYTPGGSTRVAPDALPNNPARCVTLGNLNQLTRLFPGKDFYLTEYGYNTEYSRWFGVTVSKADQARYLRKAFSYAHARYPQVKVLFWFLVDDWNPSGKRGDANGVYMGVRTSTGARKPSWYAFAGGNRLSLEAPASAKAGAPFAVSGALVYRTPDEPRSQVLTLQARKASGGAWVKVAAIETAADGTYSKRVTQRSTKVYRVVWGGVCESVARTVKTP
jgi:hypothetical protein